MISLKLPLLHLKLNKNDNIIKRIIRLSIKIIILIKVFLILINLIIEMLNKTAGNSEDTIIDANTISSLNKIFDKNRINKLMTIPIDANSIPNLYELYVILS